MLKTVILRSVLRSSSWRGAACGRVCYGPVSKSVLCTLPRTPPPNWCVHTRLPAKARWYLYSTISGVVCVRSHPNGEVEAKRSNSLACHVPSYNPSNGMRKLYKNNKSPPTSGSLCLNLKLSLAASFSLALSLSLSPSLICNPGLRPA